MTALVPPTGSAARSFGPLAGFGPAFTWGVRLALGRRRKLLAVLLVTGGIGALGGFYAVHTPSGTLRSPAAGAFQLWEILKDALLPFCVPLTALTLVAGAFQREVSERTLVYHLVRPVARRTLYLARFLGAALVAIPVALVAPLAALGVAGLSLPGSVAASVVLAVGLGVLAMGAVTYLLSVWFRHGIIAGLIYVFLVDSFMSEATGTMQRLSIGHHVLSIFHRGSDAAFGALSDRVESGAGAPVEAVDPGGVVFQMLEAEQIPWMDTGWAVLVLLAVTVVALAIGARKVTASDYPLKD